MTQLCRCEFSFYLQLYAALIHNILRSLLAFHIPTIHFLNAFFSISLSKSIFLLICSAILSCSSIFTLNCSHLDFIIKITQVYVITVNSAFLILLFISFFFYLIVLMKKISLEVSRFLIYLQFLCHHQFLNSWTWADVLIQLTYIIINIFCISFQIFSVSETDLKTENLSLLNMILLFFDPHLSFLADLLHIFLSTYCCIHCSTDLMSFTFLFFHVITVVAVEVSFSLSDLENLHELIVHIHNFMSRTFHN